MMIPFCCEGRGGDQERVSEREVVDDTRLCGCPLGTKQHSLTANLIYVHIYSPSCLVVTLVVAAGPPPILV